MEELEHRLNPSLTSPEEFAVKLVRPSHMDYSPFPKHYIVSVYAAIRKAESCKDYLDILTGEVEDRIRHADHLVGYAVQFSLSAPQTARLGRMAYSPYPKHCIVVV